MKKKVLNSKKSEKKSDDNFFSKKNIEDSISYIKESRNYIYFGIGVFVLFGMFGFLFPDFLNSIYESLTGTSLEDYIKEIMLKADDQKGIYLMGFIYINNFVVSALSMFNFGLIFQIFKSLLVFDITQIFALIFLFPIYSLFGILSVFLAASNGSVVGYVFAKVYEVNGLWEFWRILPHGIFELPAIFISLGLGIKNGCFMFSKKPFNELKIRLFASLKVLIFIILPLLFVAAIIETLLITFVK